MALETITELECDVLVAGGGPAGVPAAIAAARCGAKVLLLQDRAVLGGNASSEVRMHIVGADCSGGRGEENAVEAREGGIIEEIRLDTTVRNPQRCASMLDLEFYDKCRAEENLTLMLNTTLVSAEVENDTITKVVAERQSTEDIFHITAKVFIDCTGDGRLGAEAGAEFRHGREDKAEFGEQYAQEVADDKTLGSTLLFTATKHDKPMPFVAPSWVRKFTPELLKHRLVKLDGGTDRGLEYGFWWVEWGGELDIIKDNEVIRDELLAIMLGVWNYIKNEQDFNAENWALNWFSFLPGKRESRRFVGQHILNEKDTLESADFHDAVAFGGWPLDLHPPKGVDAIEEKPATGVPVPHLYNIPLRSLVSNNISNLMFAGRNHSASHVAFGSTRVMATCAVMGQGAGTAAAYATTHQKQPAELAADKESIQAIQQKLLREDCYLVGVLNKDEKDIARKAQVTASSEQEKGKASNAISGQTRVVDGERGAPADRAYPGMHRWMSDPAQSLPASLELRWEKPISIKQVQLIFDTGMHKPLTLSHSDGYVAKMQWGAPQPQTVRDYDVQILQDGEWKTVRAVQDNYQRRNVLDLEECVTSDALRIVVNATNGLDHARINEVRVYEDIEIW